MVFNTTCPVVEKGKDPTPFFDSSGVNFEAHRVGWAFAGICAFLACVIAFYLIYKHMEYYTKPEQQRYIIRICLLVPIYAIISWLSYRFYQHSTYYVAVRDCYEAFVIASFFILLLQYLGETQEDQKRVMRHRPPRKLLFPLSHWKYNPGSTHFLQYIKWGILQYVVVRPITTILAVIFEYEGFLCPGNLSPVFGNLYLEAADFLSVTVAMYSLITFYQTIKEDIAEHEPLLKFLCVKLVIFFCFWQSVCLDILIYFKVIKETSYWTTENISVGISAILVDFEMIIFALLHVKAFTYRIYRPDDRSTKSIWGALIDSLNPADFGREIWAGVKYGYYLITGRRQPEPNRSRYYDLEHVFGYARKPPTTESDEISMEQYNSLSIEKVETA